MRMQVSADIHLSEPNVDFGLVTWLHVELFDDEDDTKPERVGEAWVARIHVGNALDASESLLEALDADSGELEALYEVYFEDDWLKDEFIDGGGNDILYLGEMDIAPAYQGRNIDLALIRRLCDTLGQGAALAVVPYASPEDIDHWTPLGFEPSTPGAAEGYLHLKLGERTARIDDRDHSGHFKIVPNPSPEGAERHH